MICTFEFRRIIVFMKLDCIHAEYDLVDATTILQA